MPNIKDVQIKQFKKGGFRSLHHEGIRHIKVLPYLSIVQSVEGSYDIALGNGETQQTGEGGFFIAPANEQQTITHHVNPKTGGMTCRWVFLEMEVNRAFPLDRLYQFPTVLSDKMKNELHRIFERIFATDDIWQNYSDCYAMIGLLLQAATPMSAKTHKGLQSALAYIREHYRQEISVKEMADRAKMSESNFYAVFKKHMGVSPISYINHYRMSIAAERLLETTRTATEIGYSVGISDPLYFSKLFKKTYGITPRGYRAMYQTGKERE